MKLSRTADRFDPAPLRFTFSSPLVPAEWIAAHGFVPRILRPRRLDQDGPFVNRPGACAFAGSVVNEVSTASAAGGHIFTGQCDQMRRLVEFIPHRTDRPIFLMHVPSTWQTANAYRYYLNELERLSEFFIDCGGTKPSQEQLVSTMIAYEELRTAMGRQSPPKGTALTETLNDFYQRRRILCPMTQPARGIRVAVIGGPLSRDDESVFHLLEELGGSVVFDGTQNGEAFFPGRFNRRQLPVDPLEELANAYFFHVPAIFRRPNTALFSWLKQEIEKRNVQGALLVRHNWCDLWHAEVHRIREWLGVPVVDIDVTGKEGAHQLRTRVAGLMEMLR